MHQSIYLEYGKSLFDRSCAFFGIVLLFPIFCFVSLLVKFDSKGPIFFRHQRIGQNFKPFDLIKFRSMVQNAGKIGPVVTQGGDSRITRVGYYLRKYKVDELPQLINVLLGHMSLVGPRPEVKKYVNLFRNDYQQILSIKPGITDYAALEYRDEEEVLEQYEDMEKGYTEEVLPAKINLYKNYLTTISFREDLNIIFHTLIKIVKK